MKTILTIIAAISFIMIPAEAESSLLQVLWSGGWGCILVISAKLLDKYYLSKEEEGL
jgi:hypothetical protein